MNPEDREFVTPFHILVARPKKVLVAGGQAEYMDGIKHEVHTLADQRDLGEKLMSGEYIEAVPLVIQYAELMALGCLELKPEV